MVAKHVSGVATGKRSARCAIYTRKSTEEGLDQEFNSLDAQREACAAYVLSQRHEGWTLLPDYYDDGGYSGGNIDRPGLRQLLAEVEAGRVDVIVVYKVDRLTRSLADFAKIVDVLDARGASFVSITQSFNTTTSMGRLTLNVLLSFAQFEREVISERVRDKIAASKKKGMWMGGAVPLGYDVVARKLIVNEPEAAVVRDIMQRYLALGTVRRLQDALQRAGVRTKLQHWTNGRTRGGVHFGRGTLYHLLTNRLYRGEIRHRDQFYPGEHDAIVPEELWDAVQARIASNAVERRMRTTISDVSLLAGRIVDDQQRRMAPSHASKGQLRYRYYASVNAEDEQSPAPSVRIAAGDVEEAVLITIQRLLGNEADLVVLLGDYFDDGRDIALVGAAARALAHSIRILPSTKQRQLMCDIDVRLVVNTDRSLSASVGIAALAQLLAERDVIEDERRYPLRMPDTPMKRGHELRLALPANGHIGARRDGRLIALLLKADQAHKKLFAVGAAEVTDTDFSTKHTARLARLSFLAPDIVAAILDGSQPGTLTARKLLRATEVPLDWHQQRRMFGLT